MGRLSRFTYREIARRSKAFGFEFDRQARGSHELWWNPVTRKHTVLPHHPGDLPEGTLKAILKQAEINEDAFLAM